VSQRHESYRRMRTSKKKDREIGEVVSNFGFAFEVFKVIAHAVTALGGTIKDLQRIIKEPELQQKIAELVVIPVYFRVSVVYTQPGLEELKRRFALVSPFYDASHSEGPPIPFEVIQPDKSVRRFEPIERCRNISTENRDIAFEYIHFDCLVTCDEVLAEMDRKGLRPALYEELLCFAEAYPDEWARYPVAAIGSRMKTRSDVYRAALIQRRLGDHLSWLSADLVGEITTYRSTAGDRHTWNSGHRFLATRK